MGLAGELAIFYVLTYDVEYLPITLLGTILKVLYPVHTLWTYEFPKRRFSAILRRFSFRSLDALKPLLAICQSIGANSFMISLLLPAAARGQRPALRSD